MSLQFCWVGLASPMQAKTYVRHCAQRGRQGDARLQQAARRCAARLEEIVHASLSAQTVAEAKSRICGEGSGRGGVFSIGTARRTRRAQLGRAPRLGAWLSCSWSNGAGRRRRSASQPPDWLCVGGGELRRLFAGRSRGAEKNPLRRYAGTDRNIGCATGSRFRPTRNGGPRRSVADSRDGIKRRRSRLGRDLHLGNLG